MLVGPPHLIGLIVSKFTFKLTVLKEAVFKKVFDPKPKTSS